MGIGHEEAEIRNEWKLEIVDNSCCDFFRGRMPESEELLLKDDKVRIKRCLYALQRDGLPPITTHNVVDDWSDPILSSIRRCQMFNTVHDRVKVGVIDVLL